MDGVGLTSLWIAAARALETEREGAWFRDPFARALAGEEGFDVLARAKAANPISPPTLEVRTRWIDERIAEARAAGIDQFVILAAGMDARAYRLDALVGSKVFEVDRDFVLAHKRARIGDAKPKATRIEVPIDLRNDWPAALASAGFDATRPTFFSVEGLVIYLEEAAVRGIFARIDSLSAPGSVVVLDLIGSSVLESPFMTATLELVKSLGAPWLFGTDEPESLLPKSWAFEVLDYGTIGHAYGRWPFPIAPRGMAGVPQSFLVQAKKPWKCQDSMWFT